MAAGGYATPGSIGIVGEEGPELLQMGDTGGTIYPNNTYNNLVDIFKESMYNEDNKAMVSPNSAISSSLISEFEQALAGDTSESGESMKDLEEILEMKKQSLASLKSLNSVLTGMFALSEQRTIASEMS